jgi:hypothetical protein
VPYFGAMLKARRGGIAARLWLCSAGLVLGCLLLAGPAAAAPPANDNFASAVAITGSTVTGNNLEATKQAGEPNHAGDPGGASVWYSWTAPSTGVFEVTTCGSQFDTLLAVYTGSAVNALTEVASNDEAFRCPSQSELVLHATSGVNYKIAVDGWSAGGSTAADTGNFVLVVSAVTPPSNDSFSTPEDLGGNSDIVVSGDNIGATKQAGEPNHAGNPGGASVWYSWTAPITGTYQIDTCFNDFDTLLAVYTGSAVGSLTPIASSDDACGPGSGLQFSAVSGTEYRIAVDGYNGGSGAALGNFELAIDFLTPPPNDNFASAQTLSGFNATATGDNFDATVQGGEPEHFPGGPFGSVWYSWTAPASGQVTIDTCGSDFDTVLAVYTGSAVSALTRLASNDDAPGCPPGSKLILNVNAGTTYRIAVDGLFETGNIVLHLALQAAATLDSQPPNSRIKKVIVDSEHHKATIKFSSSEQGGSFRCKLDGKPYRPCSSPKTYRHLDDGKHKVKVQARDAAGNLDPTAAVRKFKIEP